MGDCGVGNVYLLGVGFMLIFTAFTTCGNIEQTVIRSLTNTSLSGSGYDSLAIIYGVFSASNLIAPSVVAVVGPKLSMVLSGVVYSGYVISFSKPMTWSLYVGSILIGFAAAVLWTAQGTFLILNSDSTTINRNTGTFWALLQCSMLFGNLYVYLQWRDVMVISDDDRRTLFIVLSVISLAGTAIILTLKNTRHADTSREITEPLLPTQTLFKEKVTSTLDQITAELRSTLRLFHAKNMLLLSVTIVYSGLMLTFYSGVYGTCIGATREFGMVAKGLIGLSGIFIGIGEILGGGIFGLLCFNNQFRRTSAILLGVIAHLLGFYLIFLMIPDDAPISSADSSHHKPYLFPSPFLPQWLLDTATTWCYLYNCSSSPSSASLAPSPFLSLRRLKPTPRTCKISDLYCAAINCK
ncbi:UNC93-like protein MFSD11 isoform X2 [Pristis pectinata]|uniref:UNC93-like protein MFSD11 isoform X2 n=1 Tax=Pristis pectinata TaxID=685728 RepID=UPI00223CBBFC|nr:UNC93-like protein MFSD11 isoform X2 [Pristis pectinata]